MIAPHIKTSISQAMALLPSKMNSQAAMVQLYAIGLTESLFKHRFQIVDGKPGAKGPARGFWQFERGGGCKGVVNHPASQYWMHHVCEVRGVPFNATAIWHSIETDDVLAAAAARLLLFTDPRRLPIVGEERSAWYLYKRVWRPGKPHPEVWPANYEQAIQESRS
jgi:hypothetical protein